MIKEESREGITPQDATKQRRPIDPNNKRIIAVVSFFYSVTVYSFLIVSFFYSVGMFFLAFTLLSGIFIYDTYFL